MHGGTDTKSVLSVFFLVGTGNSKCGTCTTLLLPLFQPWYQYQFLVVPVPLYKNFQNSLHFGFHCMLASFTALHPLQTDLCLLNCVLHSLSTFTLTLESSVLHVIKNPKVRTELATQSSRSKGLTQYDLEV